MTGSNRDPRSDASTDERSDASTDGDGSAAPDAGRPRSGYYDRIRSLADEAADARESFVPPEADALPADERATSLLRTGLGPVVSLYVEARTAEWDVAFSGEELRLLHGAVNDWLALYTRCYGVETDPDFTVREAAELLLRTHNIRDTAQLLTRVPDRR